MEITITDRNIPDGAYRNRTDITSVVISDSVESIGEWAFQGCTALEKVTFKYRLDGENGVFDMQYIGTGAFYGCSNLVELNNIAGVNIKTISPYTFYNCSKLTDCLTGFDGLKSIGHYAYYGCSSLKTGVYSNYDNETTKIGDYAFYGTGIFEVNLVGKTVIGDYAFAYSEVTDVKLYNTAHIGKGAFLDCRSLENVMLGQALKHIGESAFEFCFKLHYLFIPHGVQCISQRTFFNTGQGGGVDAAWLYLDFSTHSSIPELFEDSSQYTIANRDYSPKIIVPDGLWGKWKLGDAKENKDLSDWWYYRDYIIRHSASNPYEFEADRAGLPRIRFNIHEQRFIAEEGMTWKKWVESKYNNYAMAGTITKWGLNRFIGIDSRSTGSYQYAYAVNWPCMNDVLSIYNDNITHQYTNAIPKGAISPDEKIVDRATYYSGEGAYKDDNQ